MLDARTQVLDVIRQHEGVTLADERALGEEVGRRGGATSVAGRRRGRGALVHEGLSACVIITVTLLINHCNKNKWVVIKLSLFLVKSSPEMVNLVIGN